MDEDEEKRIRQRDIAFTVFQIFELVLCLFLYIYFASVYSTMNLRGTTTDLQAFVFRGFVMSIYILSCNIIVRYFSVPKHTITPMEVFLTLFLWFIYSVMTLTILHELKESSSNFSTSELRIVTVTSKKLGTATLVTSVIFILDAVLRIDVLVIKRPQFVKSEIEIPLRIPSTGSPTSTAPSVIVTAPTETFISGIPYHNPLSIDFFWLRFPDCLVEEKQGAYHAGLVGGYTPSTGVSEETASSINREGLFPEGGLEATGSNDVMYRYSSARRKRRISNTSTTSTPALVPGASFLSDLYLGKQVKVQESKEGEDVMKRASQHSITESAGGSSVLMKITSTSPEVLPSEEPKEDQVMSEQELEPREVVTSVAEVASVGIESVSKLNEKE